MAKLHLILGGARSGKSRLAEQLAEQANKPVVYIATAQALDEEMTERIALHKLQRSTKWQLIEEPKQLTQRLNEFADKDVVILVDCLTLWLNNHLCDEGLNNWLATKVALLNCLNKWQSVKASLILVSNEVGHGIVPMGELSRQFVDESGRLHQDIAKLAEQVDFVMAGLPLNLKGQINL